MHKQRRLYGKPLLATNAAFKGIGKRRGAGSGGGGGRGGNDPNPIPKSRLARAVRDWTADPGPGLPDSERRRIARIVADSMADVGVRLDHPLRKKLSKFAGIEEQF